MKRPYNIEYTIVRGYAKPDSSDKSLLDKVNTMLKEGWDLIGGVTSENGGTLVQAMVKVEPIPATETGTDVEI